MATKSTKTSTVKAKSATNTSAPKLSRARNSDTASVLTPEAVAQRAYERFLARGQQHGFDVEDWLSAERELTQRT